MLRLHINTSRGQKPQIFMKPLLQILLMYYLTEIFQKVEGLRQARRHVFILQRKQQNRCNFSGKNWDEVNLFITNSNITATPLSVLKAWNSCNIPNIAINAFIIDPVVSIKSSRRLPPLSSDSEKKKVLKIKTQLAELKRQMKCELWVTLIYSLQAWKPLL